MVTPVFEDLSEPQTEDVRKGFVYPGDTIAFHGQYAYLDGINNNVFITPEIPLTLEITRSAAFADGAKGYVPFPGEVTYHTFTGGVFEINLTAAPVANDYQYSFRLCPFDDPTTALDDAISCGNDQTGLPEGAVDTTPAVCAGSSSYGCSTFNIKVDGNPEVNTDSWTANVQPARSSRATCQPRPTTVSMLKWFSRNVKHSSKVMSMWLGPSTPMRAMTFSGRFTERRLVTNQ